MNKFFMRTTNNFLVVPRIIFNTSIENYFFIVLIIIFHGIVNLFLGLQCFAGLAVEVDWFESLTSLGDHFENFEVEETSRLVHNSNPYWTWHVCPIEQFSTQSYTLSVRPVIHMLAFGTRILWMRVHLTLNFRKDLPILIVTGGHKN